MVIDNHMRLGVGSDSLANELEQRVYRNDDPMDILNRNRVDKEHSEPVHIAVTTGVPSAILYVLFIG